ncbi:hypothetical protein EC957_009140 [Mortierella hygrophila]|uniref:Uncharacterized protein n=1 Tax=Mortierella hygrophila TaxID=979708 RepID=A0A9P6EX26_9FUNG|nr:hypothetical protein EC957_009140 [Mortierella hygrophila]
MRSFIKCASLAVLASLLTLGMLSMMSKTTTALIFAEANPVGDEPLAYDGSLSTLATEAEDLNPSAGGVDAARLFCRPGFGRCGWGFNPWCCGPAANVASTDAPKEESVHAALVGRSIVDVVAAIVVADAFLAGFAFLGSLAILLKVLELMLLLLHLKTEPTPLHLQTALHQPRPRNHLRAPKCARTTM